MEKIAVVQIYIDGPVPKIDHDRRNEQLRNDSINDFMSYADQHGYDYHLLTQAKWPELHPQVEIFRVLNMDYDRIITVDIDIIINTDMDIIEQAHPLGLSACWRPDGGENINSGVLVWGREAREYYRNNSDPHRANRFKNRDQDEINLLSANYPVHRITSKFNDYTFSPDSYWHHYKGGLKNDYRRSR